MWLFPERSRVPVPRPALIEIVTPRTNSAAITPAENLFAAMSLAGPCSLEIAATSTARWFLARVGSIAMRRHLEAQLAAAYPQAGLRQLDAERDPGPDPARLGPSEQVAACVLVLRSPQYLPLRTFDDAEIAADQAAQADPILGILGALGTLPDGWRALSQLVITPAPDDWCRDYLRLAVEHPLTSERAARRADTSLTSVILLAGLLVGGALVMQGYQWYAAGEWLELSFLAGSLLMGAPGLICWGHRLVKRPIYDMRLVQEKVSRIAYRSEIRLAVFAPADVPVTEVEAHVKRLATAYRQFNLASGNGLRPRRLDLRQRDLRDLTPLVPPRSTPVLNTRELAGLWHLPQAGADAPLIERTTARQRLPRPGSVAHGCHIGVSAHQGRAVPVALADQVLGRHLLLVAKTRRGKSSLLLTVAHYIMEQCGDNRSPRALVVVDPHQDLARDALGLVPANQQGNVVYLDLAEQARPFGLNLLDTGLGWERDKAVANALSIFRREFDRFWGPRMEDAFRFALLTLYEVNQAICAVDPDGRARQHTILEVPAVLVDPAFRRSLLGLVTDPVVTNWWSGYFDRLDRRLQVEIANPVQTKVQRFAGSRAARAIVGQPRSTIDPLAWLPSGAIVIVNTAKGVVGEDTAALIGATLLNLIGLAISEQTALATDQRPSVTVLVDEFQTMPGADYESILSELAKYGANLVLATQSLARLETLDHERRRALRATVFANLDALFAFHTSAEDARYLVHELGNEVDEQDLVGLGEHQCYVKLSAEGERLPTFSVRLDPPPMSDTGTRDRLAAASAARYGRDAAAVERDLASAFARIEISHQALRTKNQPGQAGAGVAKDVALVADGSAKPRNVRKKRRNEHRQPKPRRAEAHQATLFEVAPGEPDEMPAASLSRSEAERSEARGKKVSGS